MPSASRSHQFGDRDRDTSIDDPDPDPAPNPSAAVAVLLQLQDRNFSSSVAKERLSNSFAFDSFVRKQASVGESKKRKKKRRLIFRGGFVRNLRTMLCTPCTVFVFIIGQKMTENEARKDDQVNSQNDRI